MPIPDPPTYDHGSTGTKPTSAIDYQNGDSLDAENLDYYLNTQFTTLDEIITALNEIQDGAITVGEADTVVDAANVTGTYKGNDIDLDGDGKVNSAEAADTAANVTGTYKGNDIDSDGDGKVDAAETADEADQVDGFDAAQLLGGATDNVTSIDLDAGQFTALQRFDADDLPSGTELVVREANVTNGEHNTPSGLSVVIRDVSANTTLTTYNGLSFGITETFTVGNSDLLLAIDNGTFTSGTGTTQTNVTGHITYDLR